MARKYEFGLHYFSHDTDMAWDRNIRKLTFKYGAVGYAVFCRILECIYKNGHFAEFSDELVFEVLDSLNMQPDDELLVSAIVGYAVSIGLFNEELFKEHQILTSHGIQQRYFEAKDQSIKRQLTKTGSISEYQHLLVELSSEEKKVEIPKDEHKTKPTRKQKQKREDIPLSEEESSFNELLKKEYPFISRMDRPLALHEYRDLVSKYGADVVDENIRNLENYKNITKYRSAKMTLDNWCKMNRNGKSKSSNDAVSNVIDGLKRISELRRQCQEERDVMS